jgi:hypothetical protein
VIPEMIGCIDPDVEIDGRPKGKLCSAIVMQRRWGRVRRMFCWVRKVDITDDPWLKRILYSRDLTCVALSARNPSWTTRTNRTSVLQQPRKMMWPYKTGVYVEPCCLEFSPCHICAPTPMQTRLYCSGRPSLWI